MRHFSVLIFAALGAVLAGSAFAQSVNVAAIVNWTAPVNDSNGIPLSTVGSPNAVTSYNVYVSSTPLTVVPTTAPLAVVTAPATTVSGTVSETVGSTVYIYVTACNSTGCSALSVAGTKQIMVPGASPGVPTNVTITINAVPPPT